MRSIQYALIVVWQTVLICVLLAVGSNLVGLPLETGLGSHRAEVEDAPRPGIGELREHLAR